MKIHLYLDRPSCYNPLVGLWSTHHPTTIQYSLTTTTHRSASYLDQSNVPVILEQTPRKPESIWFRRRYLIKFGSDKFSFRKSHEVTRLLCPSVPWFSHCNRCHTIKIVAETHSNLGIFKSLSSNGNIASIKKRELWKTSSMNITDNNCWKYVTVLRSNIFRGSYSVANVMILTNDNRACRSTRESKPIIAMAKAIVKRGRLFSPANWA